MTDEEKTIFGKLKDFASGKSIWSKKQNTAPMLEAVNCIGILGALRYTMNEPGLILKKVEVESKDGHIEILILAEIYEWEKRENSVQIG